MPWRCNKCGKVILRNINSTNTIWEGKKRFHKVKGKKCGEWIKI